MGSPKLLVVLALVAAAVAELSYSSVLELGQRLPFDRLVYHEQVNNTFTGTGRRLDWVYLGNSSLVLTYMKAINRQRCTRSKVLLSCGGIGQTQVKLSFESPIDRDIDFDVELYGILRPGISTYDKSRTCAGNKWISS